MINPYIFNSVDLDFTMYIIHHFRCRSTSFNTFPAVNNGNNNVFGNENDIDSVFNELSNCGKITSMYNNDNT